MRVISTDNNTALNARVTEYRDFVWFKARTFEAGLPFEYGFWSDVGNVTAQVLRPDTGAVINRNFEGAGSLISIGDIPLVATVEVRTVTITLSQIDEAVINLIRGYDLKQAVIEIYRGFFSTESKLMVAPATCRFDGFVDDPMITTPSENEEGSIVLTCVSHTQEMTRGNSDTRSDDSQKLRRPADNFFQDATSVGEWELFWGGKAGKIDAAGAQRIGINVPMQK